MLRYPTCARSIRFAPNSVARSARIGANGFAPCATAGPSELRRGYPFCAQKTPRAGADPNEYRGWAGIVAGQEAYTLALLLLVIGDPVGLWPQENDRGGSRGQARLLCLSRWREAEI
jgi:hypothetical protein